MKEFCIDRCSVHARDRIEIPMIVDEKDADGLKNTERLFLHLTSFVVQFRTTIKSQGVSAFRPAIFI